MIRIPRLVPVFALIGSLWVIVGFVNIGVAPYIEQTTSIDTPGSNVLNSPRPIAHNEQGSPDAGPAIGHGPG